MSSGQYIYHQFNKPSHFDHTVYEVLHMILTPRTDFIPQ